MSTRSDELKALCVARGLRWVGQRGLKAAPVYIIGEAPGADEDQQGIPFVGASGQLLDKLLAEAGFQPSSLCFTNVYKTRPPDNKIDRIGELFNAKTKDEISDLEKSFRDALIEELTESKPGIIITCGKTSTNALCPQTEVKIRKKSDEDKDGFASWRGSLLTSPYFGWPHYVIPVYHPAFLFRQWSERDTTAHCLGKAHDEFIHLQTQGRIRPLLERSFLIQPSFSEAREYLTEVLAQSRVTEGSNGQVLRGNPTSSVGGRSVRDVKPVSIDIELLKRKYVYCIGFAKSSVDACSITLWDYNPDECLSLFRLMDTIFRECKQVGQNYTSFDAHWIRALGLDIRCTYVDDTRIRHTVLWPELSHKLEFLVMQYTREPFYKDEGKGWNPKNVQSTRQMLTYNCKDCCTTYEVYDEQEKEFDGNPGLRRFYEESQMPLARRLFDIERRGVLVDKNRLGELRTSVRKSLELSCEVIKKETGVSRVIYSQKHLGSSEKLTPDILNLSSTKQLLTLFKSRGHKVSSTNEQNLQNLMIKGDVVAKEMLNVRELNKIDGTYVGIKLLNGVLYCVYIAGGTVSGRRSSKKSPLGYGTNHQNLPKHSELGGKFRHAIIARPGFIFVACDQVQAEDWLVSGIIADQSGRDKGLQELIHGVDRHKKLASFIFSLPESQCGKGTVNRFIGKKGRHAYNYGMGAATFSVVIQKESAGMKGVPASGLVFPEHVCAHILKKVGEAEPDIKGVFQAYVERELTNKRTLQNLLGRSRHFFGLHPYRDNTKIFQEAYSYIPQGTVGDNTGEAILASERLLSGAVVMESHDSIVHEVPDTLESIERSINVLRESFKRTLRFPKGLEIEIPVEFEVGYNLKDMVTCDDLSRTGLMNTLSTLHQPANHHSAIMSGVPQL